VLKWALALCIESYAVWFTEGTVTTEVLSIEFEEDRIGESQPLLERTIIYEPV
jgi:hypothetical protein